MITGSIFIIIGFIFTIPIIISKYKSKKRNEEKEKVYDEIEKKLQYRHESYKMLGHKQE